jgi:hypothetical protein
MGVIRLRALQLDKAAGGNAKDAAEGAGELEGVAEVEISGDVFDEGARGLEALGGVAHFELDDVLPGALVVVTFEKAADVGRIDVALARDFGETGDVAVVGFDVAAALLIGVEGLAADGADGDGGFGDAKDEVFDDGGADAALEGGFAEAGVDEAFEEGEEVFGGGGLDDFAGMRGGGDHQPGGLFSGEIEEIFHKRVVGVAGNGVGDGGAVGEDGAGDEAVLLATEFQASLAAGDEFEREVGEILAAEVVIGGAVFAATADDSEELGLRGLEIEVEAAGFSYLRGEKTRGAVGAGGGIGRFTAWKSCNSHEIASA